MASGHAELSPAEEIDDARPASAEFGEDVVLPEPPGQRSPASVSMNFFSQSIESVLIGRG